MQEEITFELNGCDPSKLIDYFSHPKVLPQHFKFLTSIEVLDEVNYIAEFYVKLGFISIRFRFKQFMVRGITTVYHEGVMDFPRAWWRFTLEITNYNDAIRTGECQVLLRGEYKGPLERFAHGPMREFLENVRNSIMFEKEKIFAVT